MRRSPRLPGIARESSSSKAILLTHPTPGRAARLSSPKSKTCHLPRRGPLVFFSAPSHRLAQVSCRTVLHCAHLSHPIFLSRIAWSILDCLFALLRNGTRVRPDCGHRTSTFSSCAFWEQEADTSAVPFHVAPSLSATLVISKTTILATARQFADGIPSPLQDRAAPHSRTPAPTG